VKGKRGTVTNHSELLYHPGNGPRTQIVDGGFLTWKYGVSPFYGSWDSVRHNYTSAIIMMDTVEKTFRQRSYPFYKSHRRERLAEDPARQHKRMRVLHFQEILRLDGMLQLLEVPSCEADDLVSWYFLWLQNQEPDPLPEVLSIDKDYHGVPYLYLYMTREFGTTDPCVIIPFPSTKYPKYAGRVRNPRDFLLLQCLFGDNTDSVPRLLPRNVSQSIDLVEWMKTQQCPFLALQDRLGQAFTQNLRLLILPGPFLRVEPLKDAELVQEVELGLYWNSELFLSPEEILARRVKRVETW